MQTYLYLHQEQTDIPQTQYRGKYLLKHADYSLYRATGRKGEIVSGVRGGSIRVVVDGAADSVLLAWLFDSSRLEDGVIVSMDGYEKTSCKFRFTGAMARSFRINYDSHVKEGLTTIFTIEAQEIVTDNDLHFEYK